MNASTGMEQGDKRVSPAISFSVYALFFLFGGLTSLNDVLIPKLKGIFALSYGEAMLVQSAFFIGYLLVSIPAGFLAARLGYMRAAVIGLLTMAAGALLFWPAAELAVFPAFLGALFILAAGVTIVQVVANPLISILGTPATAHSRLTFAQGFNSLGTTIFPYIGAILILGGAVAIDAGTLSPEALAAERTKEAAIIGHSYIGLALVLTVMALAVWAIRHRLADDRSPEATNPLRSFDLMRRPRFAFGMACIFLYVGAEVSIGSLLTSYLMQPGTMALSAEEAGKHLVYYWGGAMVGRFIGAAMLRLIPPGRMLAGVALGALLLVTLSAQTGGDLSGWALLAVGLCNAIMFPTIFALASEGLGTRAPEGSGLICVAIVGGAVLPPLTGHVADIAGLATALAVPAAAYAGIATYGFYARRPVSAVG